MAASAGAAGGCQSFLSACASSNASQHPYHKHCGCAIHRLLNGASHVSGTCSQVKLRGRPVEPVSLSSSLSKRMHGHPVEARRLFQGSCEDLGPAEDGCIEGHHLFQVSGLVQQAGCHAEGCHDA